MTQTQTNPINLNRALPHGPVDVQASRLRWLIRLRWLYVTAIAGLTVGVSCRQPDDPATYLLSAAAAMMLAYNFLFQWLVDRASDQAGLRRQACVQIAMDLLVLVVLMHVTGGACNVLLAVVVFHLAVAASLQSVRTAYFHAALASALLVALMLLEYHEAFEPMLAGFLGSRLTGFFDFARTGSTALSLTCCFLIVGGCFFGIVYLTDAILERLRGINRRLVEANRQLSGLDLAKSRFLRVSSHQLRGPLAAIGALICATQEVGGFNPRQNDLMLKIRSRADEMMIQLDEMMVLSTIKEHASETLRDRPVNVCQVVGESVAAFAEEARQRGLSLSCGCGGEALVWAWEDALETVLEHLLSNAMQYTPSGGKVNVQTMPRPHSVEVEVTDTGIGIPAEQQDRLFHEFFRATNARQVCGGTGLGLSIVKATIERLGGNIAIVSTPGQGTKVSMSLPLASEKFHE